MMRTFIASIVLLLVGCASQLQAPKTFIEQVAYAEVTAQAMLQTIGDLTCTKGHDARGVCLEPGKPLKPQQAIDLIGKVSAARSGLKAAVRLPESGGTCFGSTRTPPDCLRAVQTALLELEAYLAQQGRSQ